MMFHPLRAACLAVCVLTPLVGRATFAETPAPPIAPTFAQDLAKVEVPLSPDYAAAKHPRLLFSAADKPALQQKAKTNPAVWNPVLESAKRLATVPAADVIKSGEKYWQIERVESGALAYFVTGDQKHLDATLQWMIPHCKEPVWGTGYRDNLDLQASWYLYHLSLAYDILHDDIPEADRKIIVDGLAAHARAIYDSFDPAGKDHRGKFSFDQNHTYIPAVALTAASLALLGDVPEAKDWLKRAYVLMNRCRYVLGDDGYYYEGYGYWTYALHWHARYDDLISRATGQQPMAIPALAESWRYALHLSLPASPRAFDIHDSNTWSGDNRPDLKTNNYAWHWRVASVNDQAGNKTAAGANAAAAAFYHKHSPDNDYPAASFLWYAPDVQPTPLDKITPYHHFGDHDVIAWRSGWTADDTVVLFRGGPPEGHAAAAKLKYMTDWTPNAGHVHPDIGAFYLFAKGAYLAVSTGYTAEKWTRDHNSLLVDGKGQGMDGSYWNDRGVSYSKFDDCWILAHFLSDHYAYASAAIAGAYTNTPGVNLVRSILATRRYLLVIDDMAGQDDHKLTWLVHADAPFKASGNGFIASRPTASLCVIPLAPGEIDSVTEPTKVMAGRAPGKGVETQRGYHLALTMKNPARSARLVNLLVPLGPNELPPTVESTNLDGDRVSLTLLWPDKKRETIALHLKWTQGTRPGPAAIDIK